MNAPFPFMSPSTLRLFLSLVSLPVAALTALADPMSTPSAPLTTVASFAARAEKHEPLSVVFFGGSLTWGANSSDPQRTSYRGLMMRYLQEKYPNTPFTFNDAAIGGSGSQLGMFRTERDVLSRKPDLVFLDFTVNDGADDAEVHNSASYERIVRDLLAHHTAVMPVLFMFRWHAEKPDAPLPPRHQLHLQLGAAYGLPVANALSYVCSKVKEGMKPTDIWNIGHNDGAHPGDEGYQLFFEAVRNRFEQAIHETTPTVLPAQTVFDDLYPKRTRLILTDALPQGWVREKTYRTALWFDGMASRWMGDVATAAAKNNPVPLEVEFEGSSVAYFGERNGLAPDIKVWIDGKPIQAPKTAEGDFLWHISTARFAPPKNGSGNLFIHQQFAKNLPDGKHLLRIEPIWDGTDKNSELRIESILSAGR